MNNSGKVIAEIKIQTNDLYRLIRMTDAKKSGNERKSYRYNERGKLFTIVDFTDYRNQNESYVARFYAYDELDRVSSMTYSKRQIASTFSKSSYVR